MLEPIVIHATRNRRNRLIVLVSVVVFAAILFIFMRRGANLVDNNQGYEPDQPIAFSHKVHAGDNAISCLYCHSSAEKGRHAGIPAASVCMNCHSNIKKESPEIRKITKALDANEVIEWVRVHRLADFVYFSHEQHVAVGQINCQTCHGAVEKMTRLSQDKNMTMGWCIECHKNSDVVIHDTLKTKKVSEVGGTDCAKCHY